MVNKQEVWRFGGGHLRTGTPGNEALHLRVALLVGRRLQHQCKWLLQSYRQAGG
jgi:hypothetical protein